jgi:integrase
MRFRSDAELLQAFCRAMGEIDATDVKPKAVLAFIAGTGPVTTYWRQKFKILSSFYRYAIGRGMVSASPLPTNVPNFPPSLTPYIYSTEELKRLLSATEVLRAPRCPLRALVFRTLLLLLYGTGMRIAEVLSLTLNSVDLKQHVLTVRDTKFLRRRRQLPMPAGEASAFFVTRTGTPLGYHSVNELFDRMRKIAGVRRESEARYQPRIHDLRQHADSPIMPTRAK